MALLRGYKRIYHNFIERSLAQRDIAENQPKLQRDGKDLHNYEWEMWPGASLSWVIAVHAYPLFLMAKDIADTFKPYKDWRQVRTNAAQPLYGIGNLLYGLWRALAFIVHLLIDVVGLPFWLGRSIYRYNKWEEFRRWSTKLVQPTFIIAFSMSRLFC
jgi:hypothetical protein